VDLRFSNGPLPDSLNRAGEQADKKEQDGGGEEPVKS
jgi:hypothetical protein